MKRLTPREERNITDIIMFVVAIICTGLVIYDVVTLHFTPLTLILDVLILIVDVSFIVRFIKRKKIGY